jgi:hypothetical protein
LILIVYDCQLKIWNISDQSTKPLDYFKDPVTCKITNGPQNSFIVPTSAGRINRFKIRKKRLVDMSENSFKLPADIGNIVDLYTNANRLIIQDDQCNTMLLDINTGNIINGLRNSPISNYNSQKNIHAFVKNQPMSDFNTPITSSKIIIEAVDDGTLLKEINSHYPINTMAFNGQGTELATVSKNHIAIYDINSGNQTMGVDLNQQPHRIAFSPDATEIALLFKSTHEIIILKKATGEVIKRVQFSKQRLPANVQPTRHNMLDIDNVAFGADGNTLATIVRVFPEIETDRGDFGVDNSYIVLLANKDSVAECSDDEDSKLHVPLVEPQTPPFDPDCYITQDSEPQQNKRIRTA